MPYIKQDNRGRFLTWLDECPPMHHPGELNYVLTAIAKNYVVDNGSDYRAWNDIAGAFMNCYMELYRRKIGPYEDEKIKENGDV